MARKKRPATQDAASGDSQSEVRAREPETAENDGSFLDPYSPEQIAALTPQSEPPAVDPVGGATEPPRHRCEALASEFAQSWENVTCGDVIAVLTIAAALCRIAAIVIPLFMGHAEARNFHRRKIRKAVESHFRTRGEVFWDQFAEELTAFVYRLPDNGVSKAEVTLMLSELQANGTRSARH